MSIIYSLNLKIGVDENVASGMAADLGSSRLMPILVGGVEQKDDERKRS